MADPLLRSHGQQHPPPQASSPRHGFAAFAHGHRSDHRDPASGSAHHQPSSAFAPRPTSSAIRQVGADHVLWHPPLSVARDPSRRPTFCLARACHKRHRRGGDRAPGRCRPSSPPGGRPVNARSDSITTYPASKIERPQRSIRCARRSAAADSAAAAGRASQITTSTRQHLDQANRLPNATSATDPAAMPAPTAIANSTTMPRVAAPGEQPGSALAKGCPRGRIVGGRSAQFNRDGHARRIDTRA